MKISFGIIGRMGAGKTVASYSIKSALERKNVKIEIVSVDELRRYMLYKSNDPSHIVLRKKIAKEFNLRVDGTSAWIESRELRMAVFKSNEAIDRYNQLINKGLFALIDNYKDNIMLEWAMLAEDGFLPLVDYNVISIGCGEWVRKKRLIVNADIPLAEIEKRDMYQLEKLWVPGDYQRICRNHDGFFLTFDTTNNPGEKEYSKLAEQILERMS